MHDLGEAITRSIDVTNAAGDPADADSTPTYAITLPDLTAGISPAVQHAGLGEYYVVYPSLMSGLHREVWTAVVAGEPVVIRRSFTVEDTVPLFVDTEEALAHLRAAGIIVSPADLEQLRFLCGVACEAVEEDLGITVAARTVTETRSGGRGVARLALAHWPVISVTTVVENGVTLGAGDYFLDPAGWVLRRGTTTAPLCWAPGRANIVVTHVPGYLVPPRVLRKVALNGVQRMWAGSQQMPHPSMDDFGAEQQAAAGVLTPLELAAYGRFRPELIA